MEGEDFEEVSKIGLQELVKDNHFFDTKENMEKLTNQVFDKYKKSFKDLAEYDKK